MPSVTYDVLGQYLADFEVPAGVTSIHAVIYGADGGDSLYDATGGTGALVTCDIAVTPGEFLDVFVGCEGGGKGRGAEPCGEDYPYLGYYEGRVWFFGNWVAIDGSTAGGDGSGIARSGTSLAVAGGGGGCSACGAEVTDKDDSLAFWGIYGLGWTSTRSRNGGAGGGGTGESGTDGSTPGAGSSPGTTGGDVAPYQEATGPSGNLAGEGGYGETPSGSVAHLERPGGGGGGGLSGGGGGGGDNVSWSHANIGSEYVGSGGGGGANYTGGTGVSNATTAGGTSPNGGNGLVVISWDIENPRRIHHRLFNETGRP